MNEQELHRRFDQAVDFVNSYTEPLPADFLLMLYAYFKIANRNYENPGSRTPLINAFKANALFQAQSNNIGPKEAMEKYIDLVDKQLRKPGD